MNPAPKKEPATQETVAVAAGKKATADEETDKAGKKATSADDDKSKDKSRKPAKPMVMVELHHRIRMRVHPLRIPHYAIMDEDTAQILGDIEENQEELTRYDSLF